MHVERTRRLNADETSARLTLAKRRTGSLGGAHPAWPEILRQRRAGRLRERSKERLQRSCVGDAVILAVNEVDVGAVHNHEALRGFGRVSWHAERVC